jgi:hypothetical protein
MVLLVSQKDVQALPFSQTGTYFVASHCHIALSTRKSLANDAGVLRVGLE